MNKKYGTTKGMSGIIIKQINNATTQLGTKILAFIFLRKCRKEEVPAGVVVVVAQCAKGSSMS